MSERRRRQRGFTSIGSGLAIALALGLILGSAHAAEIPAWLEERTRALFSMAPTSEAERAAAPDTLLALAGVLDRHGAHATAAQAQEKAGILAFRHAQLERAVAIWQDGLDYARAHDERQRESALLNALAVGFSVAGRTDEALDIYAQSLTLKTELADTAGVSRTWGNLANAYSQLGRVAEALAAGAEAERWSVLAGNVAGQTSLLINRAGLMGQLGRHHEALALAEEGLALAVAHDVGDGFALAHQRRAESLLALGRPEEALTSLNAGIAHHATTGDRYYALFARQRRVDVLRALGRPRAARATLDSVRAEVEAQGPERLLTILMIQDGLLLLDAGEAAAAAAAFGDAVASFESRRDGAEDQASRAGIYGDGGSAYGSLAHSRLALGDTLGAWRAAERGRGALFRERLADTAAIADLATIQDRLAAASAVLVQPVETQSEPLTWLVITPTVVRAVATEFTRALATEARAALALLTAGESLADCHAALDRLATDLIADLVPLIDADAERLYVVPPSYLDGFPLALLPLADGSRSLGDRWTVTYLPGASSLVALSRRMPSTAGMLALADPAGDAGAASSVLPVDPLHRAATTPLPEARREVAAIAPSDAAVFVGAEARPSRLTTPQARSAAVVHLACHALSDPLDGSRSALLLAPEPGERAPAVLRAAAAESLTFQADLMVLSACQSGLGRSVLGEGGFGLPRSLLIAGARSVVSSLWEVEDAMARRFMEAFYDGLARGLSRDRALHDAGRRLAAAGAPPADWAGFVLTGIGHEPVTYLAAAAPARGRYGWLPFAGLAAAVALVAAVAAARRRRRHRNPL